jgi:hypothetical protein
VINNEVCRSWKDRDLISAEHNRFSAMFALELGVPLNREVTPFFGASFLIHEPCPWN